MTPLDPALLERFEPLRELGGGGQARVVLARDRRGGELVALKLLRALPSGHAGERLVREARALASFRHPHLVRYVDLISDGPQPVLVMEAIDGLDLAHHLEAHGPLSPARTRSLGAALAGALHQLHAKGYLHRDVKPANVLLTEDRGPVLVDLGMVVAVDSTRYTQTGVVLGTPAYLAPELFDRAGSSPASDVFALGLVLHECLSGESAYNLQDLLEPGLGGALPEAPARRLDRELGRVAADCLQQHPGYRPAAEEVARALAAAAAPGPPGEPFVMRPPPGAGPGQAAAATPAPGAPPAPARRGLAGVLFLVVAAAAAALWPAAPPAPLPSLELEATPVEVRVRWRGDEGGEGVELLADGAPVLRLGAGRGTLGARLPLPGPRRFAVRRAGRTVPFGPASDRERMVAPARLAAAEELSWAAGDQGLELRIPAGTWVPPLVRLDQAGERWEVEPVARRGGGARVPLGRPLEGHLGLAVTALARDPEGRPQRLGPPVWVSLDLTPRAYEAVTASLFGGAGVLPEPRPLRLDAPPAPAPWSQAVRESGLTPVTAMGPGPVAARLGGREFLFGRTGLFHGSFAFGFPRDERDPAMVLNLPPNVPWIRDAGLVALRDGVAGRVSDRADDQAGASWFVARTRTPMTWTQLDTGGFQVAAGPYPRPGGGAVLVGADLRLRLVDDAGGVAAASGVAFPRPFRISRGVVGRVGRHLALAGRFQGPDEPGMVVLDLQEGRVLGGVAGFPGRLRHHPVWVARGAGEGAWVLAGRELVHLAGRGLLARLASEGSVLAVPTLEAGGVAWRRAQAADEGAEDVLARRHAMAACGVDHGAFVYLDPSTGDPGAPAGRWMLWLHGPAGPAVHPLDQDAFPTRGSQDLSALLDMDDASGVVAVAAESRARRWVLELHAPGAGRALVRWSLHSTFSIQAPRLLPEGVHLMTMGKHSIYPLPPGLLGTPGTPETARPPAP